MFSGGTGGAYQIVVGELPSTVIELYDGAYIIRYKNNN